MPDENHQSFKQFHWPTLDPDQARRKPSAFQTVWIHNRAQCFVGPDLGPNCLKRLSADDTGREIVKSPI